MAIEVVRTSDEFSEMFWILTELGQRLPQLRDNAIYRNSIPHYLENGTYKFITAGPRTTSDRFESQTAFGFVTFYQSWMPNGIVMAVEAFWFKDDNLDSQLSVLSYLKSLARKMGVHGVCIARSSVNTPTSLEELLRRGELDGDPILPDSVALQPKVEGIYSAFDDGQQSKKLFLASCVRIFPQEFFGSFTGFPNAGNVVLYRGEGRKKNEPYWNCGNLQELAALFMERGFPARACGSFTGTVQEQILQQGYVNQPTVSLTKSFRIAADYATHNGEQEGVVFKIDVTRLRKQSEVFDAYAPW